MKWYKGVFLALFTVVITSIAIGFNISTFFMGNYATLLNFVVSITFLLLWFAFSFLHGKIQNKKYLVFILAY